MHEYYYCYLHRIKHVGDMLRRGVVFPPQQSHDGSNEPLHVTFVRFDLQLLLVHVVSYRRQKPEVVFNAKHQINLKCHSESM